MLTTLERVNGFDQCFGNLANYDCDAILWFNRQTHQGYIVFDKWLTDPITQLALREHLLERLRNAHHQGFPNFLPVKVFLCGRVDQIEQSVLPPNVMDIRLFQAQRKAVQNGGFAS